MNEIAPRTDRPIVLVGSMGAGKSSVGPLLARRLSLPFRETDSIVERMAGLSIPLIFSELGESRFRSLEAEALREALEGCPSVISTGGGAPCNPSAWSRLRAAGALTVYLSAQPSVLASRVSSEGRPLLLGASGFEAKEAVLSRLLSEREPWYRRCDVRLDSTGAPDAVAALAAEAVTGAGMRSVPVRLGEESYCFLARDGLADLGEMLARRLPPATASARCSLVCDENVRRLYAGKATESLRAAGYEVLCASFPPGEAAKTLETASVLIDRLLEGGHQRGSPVVALGGGVTGDLAGFAASLLHRGCPVVQVPTTLLAMVDASVGGKTAVNHPAGKNLIGSFHQPSMVHAPLDVLSTLPRRHYVSGLGEVVKTALLERGTHLLEMLEKDGKALLEREPRTLLRVITRSVAVKAEVVEQDPRERIGRRRLLNLGHTIGHALEAEGGFERWLHGEAVGLGLVAAARVGASLGLSPPKLPERLRALLRSLELPWDISPLLSSRVLLRLGADKKAEGDKVHFVVPVAEGGAEIVLLSAYEIESILR